MDTWPQCLFAVLRLEPVHLLVGRLLTSVTCSGSIPANTRHAAPPLRVRLQLDNCHINGDLLLTCLHKNGIYIVSFAHPWTGSLGFVPPMRMLALLGPCMLGFHSGWNGSRSITQLQGNPSMYTGWRHSALLVRSLFHCVPQQ